ncbi:hypothetical protein [Streptomyces sp. NBC_00483]|uniref:hypothetical protein n=1 Tax=Streptomyces sp. NBC_00483 TaxID=2975756 RepID=UPI002E17C887
MSNVEVTPNYLTVDTSTPEPAGQAVGTGDTAVLTPDEHKPFKGRYLLIRMKESGSVATSTATVKAGDRASQHVRGDRTAETFTSGQVKYVQVDLNRYLQADGSVHIDVGGVSGSVTFTVIQLSNRT